MKIRLLSLISFFLLTIVCTPAFAVKKGAVKAVTETEVSDVDAKKAKKFEEKLGKLSAKIEKKFAKKQAKVGDAGVDFSDPVDKWMWFWIFGWGLAILLGLVGLGTLGWIVGVAGTVALILWLVKKFS